MTTQGTIKFFNVDKGYGFIGRDAGEDVFVHVSSLTDQSGPALAGGQTVEFDVVTGKKGPEATHVRIV